MAGTTQTEAPRIGTRAEWRDARIALLAKEKELNRTRDALAVERRALPWVPVERDYRFVGPEGEVGFAELFAGRGQLLVYHFMFGPDWDEGCPSCSFWADSFNGSPVHLAARDVSFVCVSHAPQPKLAAYQTRMGWSFRWYSSTDGEFNRDFGVSFTPQQVANGAEYNFRETQVEEELPGISAFARDGSGGVFHTYSSYSRGLDPFNTTYQLLDLAPRGRDEGALDYPAQWLRRHDRYDD